MRSRTSITHPATRNAKDLVRGGIYYINKHLSEGSEMFSGRPGIIVSDPYISGIHTVVSVVYLTTKHKSPRPCRVPIESSGVSATALCETITSVDVSKIRECLGICTVDEIIAIKRGLASHLAMSVMGHNISAEEKDNAQIQQLQRQIQALESQLRESTRQLQKAKDRKKGCDSCAGDEAVFWQGEDDNAFVDSEGNMDVMAEGHSIQFKVRHCPVCGRILGAN